MTIQQNVFLFHRCFLTLLGCNSAPEIFSESKPFAIEVKKVKSYYTANAILNRLESLNLEPYIVLIQDEGNSNSKWFSIMMGAASNLKEIGTLKEVVEDVLKVSNMMVYKDAKRSGK